jgi:hypothetical protein
LTIGRRASRLRPIRPGLRVLGLAILVTWPTFILGFFVYYGSLCPRFDVAHMIAPICSRWHGVAGMHLGCPKDS